MRWRFSWRTDPNVRPLADRHYNRQKIGAVGFVPPGRCLVLKTADNAAYWVTSWPFAEYVLHEWGGAYVCSSFRNEGTETSSELIREAVAATRWKWPNVPELGMITFIDPTKVRPTMIRSRPTFGDTYVRAGFHYVGTTKSGLLAFQMYPKDMPEPMRPLGHEKEQKSPRKRHCGACTMLGKIETECATCGATI